MEEVGPVQEYSKTTMLQSIQSALNTANILINDEKMLEDMYKYGIKPDSNFWYNVSSDLDSLSTIIGNTGGISYGNENIDFLFQSLFRGTKRSEDYPDLFNNESTHVLNTLRGSLLTARKQLGSMHDEVKAINQLRAVANGSASRQACCYTGGEWN